LKSPGEEKLVWAGFNKKENNFAFSQIVHLLVVAIVLSTIFLQSFSLSFLFLLILLLLHPPPPPYYFSA